MFMLTALAFTLPLTKFASLSVSSCNSYSLVGRKGNVQFTIEQALTVSIYKKIV